MLFIFLFNKTEIFSQAFIQNATQNRIFEKGLKKKLIEGGHLEKSNDDSKSKDKGDSKAATPSQTAGSVREELEPDG